MANETYSLTTGLIFVFNLILGTGVLTMPSVFASSGWLFGIIIIVLLSFVSYVQTTFVIEAMANANFYTKIQVHFKANASQDESHQQESSALLSNINECSLETYESLSSVEANTDTRRASLDSLDRLSFEPKSRFTQMDTNTSSMQQNKLKLELNLLYLEIMAANSIVNANTFASSSNLAEISDDLDSVMSTSKQEDQRKEIQATLMHQSDGQLDGKAKDVFTRLVPNLRVYFSIKDKFELGHLSELFFNRMLLRFFFTSIIVYLLGDLLIYNTMMSKSLRVITCTNALNASIPESEQLDSRCWPSWSASRTTVYRIYLLAFASILTPLAYLKLQKTKMIQVVTIVLRWLAFLSMIGITLKMFIKGETNGKPSVANVLKMPKLFGICIYSFMCHHSLPSFLSPIRNKTHLNRGIVASYLLALVFYLVIALTGIFAFEHLDDVYTLNFAINGASGQSTSAAVIPFFDIFLPTFPIFTLFSSYIFIAITLINNIKILFLGAIDDYNPKYKWVTYSLPALALLPPLVIAMFTEDVASIVSYVGSYTGSLIQYVFPTMFVYYSRRIIVNDCLAKYIRLHLDSQALHIAPESMTKLYVMLNHHVSPFRSNFWILATAIWWIVSIALVTAQHILEKS